MIILKYVSDIGALIFSGSGNVSPIKIKSIKGLETVPKQYDINEYVGVPGQIATNGLEGSRTITISGDIASCDTSYLAMFNQVLSSPGALFIYNGQKRRKINCRLNDIAGLDTRNKIYQQFVVQFICDYPFFEDVALKKPSLFERIDMIQDSFTLPCVFTERIHNVTVINEGQRKTQPVIKIRCIKESESAEQYNIDILNRTTGEKFVLEYKMSEGEEIIIDFPQRKITSNMPTEENNNGNLIIYMSLDSYLSDFHLSPGINNIECLNHDEESEIAAVCEYTSKYVEAVI